MKISTSKLHHLERDNGLAIGLGCPLKFYAKGPLSDALNKSTCWQGKNIVPLKAKNINQRIKTKKLQFGFSLRAIDFNTSRRVPFYFSAGLRTHFYLPAIEARDLQTNHISTYNLKSPVLNQD